MSTDLTALNKRIACEFMGWTLDPDFDHEFWIMSENACWATDFSPTVDARAAYVVLEKIASKFRVTIFNSFYGGVTAWVIECEEVGIVAIKKPTLPLAISLLAEAILNSPSHMELFREEK